MRAKCPPLVTRGELMMMYDDFHEWVEIHKPHGMERLDFLEFLSVQTIMLIKNVSENTGTSESNLLADLLNSFVTVQ